MLIKVKQPNGIIPKLDDKPQNGANTAENVDLQRGRWDTINTPSTASPTETWKQRALSGYDVVEAPVYNDQFSRYLYTGHSSGKLRMGGLIDDDNSDAVHDGDNDTDADDSNNDNTTAFERDAVLPRPSNITTYSSAYMFNPSAVTCKWWNYTAGYITCTYVGHEMTDSGCKIKFRFPGTTHGSGTICTDSKFFLTVDGTTIPSGSPSCTSSITNGETVALTYSSKEYGQFGVVSVSHNIFYVLNTGTGVYTWAASDVEFTCDLNYSQAVTQDVVYLMTYVNDLGMEGSPYKFEKEEGDTTTPDPLIIIPKKPGQIVTLSGLSVSSNATIKKKRLYRSVAGTNENAYLFLAEITNATTSYEDSKSDAELNEVIGAYGDPKENMSGLVAHASGALAAFKGKDVYISEPYYPHIWPVDYAVTVKSDVVGLATAGNDIIVMTKGFPEILSFAHPSVLTQTKLPLAQACSAKKSIVTVGNSVYYASPDGIVQITGGSGQLITKPFFTREQWQALTPGSMIAGAHDNKLYMYTSGGLYIFDFAEGLSTLTTSSETGITAFFSDVENDILYITQSATNKSWGTSSTAEKITWKSKDYVMPKPVTFSCGRVYADTYPSVNPIHFKVYADDTEVADITVTSEDAFRLPMIRPSRKWNIAIESYVPVNEILISQSMDETQVTG